MDIIVIILIGISLSADAFAIAVASGAAYKTFHIPHAFRIAGFFGFFQAIMPLIGWLAGTTMKSYIAGFDHWIAFGLLTIVGAKMLYESAKARTVEKNIDLSNMFVLLVLSIATSIDALAVGITLSMLRTSIAAAAIIIGITTFIISLVGVAVGNKVGHLFENKIEALAGLVLIGIGIKILLSHLL